MGTRTFEIDHTQYGGMCMDLIGMAVAWARKADIYVPSDGEYTVLRDPKDKDTVKVMFAGRFGENHGRSTPAQQRACFSITDKYGLPNQDDVNEVIVRGARPGALRGLGQQLKEDEFVSNTIAEHNRQMERIS